MCKKRLLFNPTAVFFLIENRRILQRKIQKQLDVRKYAFAWLYGSNFFVYDDF